MRVGSLRRVYLERVPPGMYSPVPLSFECSEIVAVKLSPHRDLVRHDTKLIERPERVDTNVEHRNVAVHD
jgi:hypothetical protein